MASRPFEDFKEDEIIDLFMAFCASHGMEPAKEERRGNKEISWRMKRPDEDTKKGTSSGYAHLRLDVPQNGTLIDFRNEKIKWSIVDEVKKRPELFRNGASFAKFRKLTAEEQAQRDRERAAQKAAAEAEAAREFEKVRLDTLRSYKDESNEIGPYGASGPGVEYLRKKSVPAFPGVKLSWKPWKIFPAGSLVIPFYDVLTDKFITLQRIKPDGKGFASGFGGHAAAFWILPGNADSYEVPSAPRCAPVVILCEGYATGATCAELFGLPVGITGDAGKLENVARAILAAPSWGRTRLIIAADDDNAKTNEFKQTAGIPIAKKYLDNPPKNSGKDAALKAFNLDRARVYPAPPPWKWNGNTPEVEAARANPDKPPSDWNDFAAIYPDEARDAARAALERAKAYFISRQ